MDDENRENPTTVSDDIASKLPRSYGGLFGIPKDWLELLKSWRRSTFPGRRQYQSSLGGIGTKAMKSQWAQFFWVFVPLLPNSIMSLPSLLNAS
jgi:hypothetical protein